MNSKMNEYEDFYKLEKEFPLTYSKYHTHRKLDVLVRAVERIEKKLMEIKHE